MFTLLFLIRKHITTLALSEMTSMFCIEIKKKKVFSSTTYFYLKKCFVLVLSLYS